MKNKMSGMLLAFTIVGPNFGAEEKPKRAGTTFLERWVICPGLSRRLAAGKLHQDVVQDMVKVNAVQRCDMLTAKHPVTGETFAHSAARAGNKNVLYELYHAGLSFAETDKKGKRVNDYSQTQGVSEFIEELSYERRHCDGCGCHLCA